MFSGAVLKGCAPQDVLVKGKRAATWLCSLKVVGLLGAWWPLRSGGVRNETKAATVRYLEIKTIPACEHKPSAQSLSSLPLHPCLGTATGQHWRPRWACPSAVRTNFISQAPWALQVTVHEGSEVQSSLACLSLSLMGLKNREKTERKRE